METFTTEHSKIFPPKQSYWCGMTTSTLSTWAYHWKYVKLPHQNLLVRKGSERSELIACFDGNDSSSLIFHSSPNGIYLHKSILINVLNLILAIALRNVRVNQLNSDITHIAHIMHISRLSSTTVPRYCIIGNRFNRLLVL